MKNIILISALTLIYFSGLAQDKASDYYTAGYYKEASVLFEKELSKNRGNNDDLQIKLADSYYRLNDFKKSIEIYERLYKNENRDSLTLIRLTELNRAFCNYDEANKYFAIYVENLESGNREKLDAESYIRNKIEFPQSNSNKNESTEISILDLPKIDRGMGYTFLENGDLLGGITEKDKKSKTSFTTLGTFSLSSGFKEVEVFEFKGGTSYFNAYPSYNSKKKKIYFTANISDKRKSFKENKNVLQIYSISLIDQSEPELLPFNKSEYNYTHPAITDDASRLYFVSDMPGGYGGFDLYFVDRTDDGWGEVKNCGGKINTKFNELTPYVNGDSLYFSSYGHQNYGGSDVFLSIINGDEFQDPQNLGLPVNSCKNDFAFIFSPQNEYGLLTSDRNSEASSKDDVYKILFPLAPFSIVNESTKDPIAEVSVKFADDQELTSDSKGEWEKRINVGDSVSVTFDNPYFETKSFDYTSITKDELEDLRNVSLAPIMISGQVIDEITGKPIDEVRITLYEKVGDEWELVEMKKSDADGRWEFHVRKDREYKVVQEKDRYLSHNEIIPRYDDSQELRNEVLSRMNPFSLKYDAKKDLVIQIDNIYFDFNSSYIQKESYPVLEKLKNFLNENPNVKVELSAHTDCMGEDKYNLWLSERRARSSKKYLLSAGISSDRIVAKGYGEQQMIVKDCELQKNDDSKAQKNRRVEVKIL